MIHPNSSSTNIMGMGLIPISSSSPIYTWVFQNQLVSNSFTSPLLSARSQCTFIQICPVTWHSNTLKEKLGLCIFKGPSRVQTWIHVRAKYISKAYKEPTTTSIRPWLDIALKESFQPQLREKCLAKVATSKGYQQSRYQLFPLTPIKLHDNVIM